MLWAKKENVIFVFVPPYFFCCYQLSHIYLVKEVLRMEDKIHSAMEEQTKELLMTG